MRQGVWEDKLRKSIETYFDALEQVAADLKNDDTVSDYETHNIVDYLNTTMAFIVMRIEPLHGPLMTYCLQQMERIDPDANALLLDNLVRRYRDNGETSLSIRLGFYKREIDFLKKLSVAPDNDTYEEAKRTIVPALRGLHLGHLQKRTKSVLSAYRNAGSPVIPKDEILNNYADIKRLQLIKMAAPLADLLAPSTRRSGDIKTAQARVEKLQMEMFETLSRTVNGP